MKGLAKSERLHEAIDTLIENAIINEITTLIETQHGYKITVEKL